MWNEVYISGSQVLLKDSVESDNPYILIWSRAALTKVVFVFLPSSVWTGTSFNICRQFNEKWATTKRRDGQDALQNCLPSIQPFSCKGPLSKAISWKHGTLFPAELVTKTKYLFIQDVGFFVIIFVPACAGRPYTCLVVRMTLSFASHHCHSPLICSTHTQATSSLWTTP